jgi:hypothetical protein
MRLSAGPACDHVNFVARTGKIVSHSPRDVFDAPAPGFESLYEERDPHDPLVQISSGWRRLAIQPAASTADPKPSAADPGWDEVPEHEVAVQ